MREHGPTVELRNLRHQFGELIALDNVSLTLPARSSTVILGPSGSGKTTLLRMLGGFEVPDGGSILFGGQDAKDLPPHRRDIGFVFQNRALFPHLDVAGNVGFALRQRGIAATEIRSRVGAMLDLVGMSGFERRSIDHLSGGQAQRVALARALIFNPRLLVLDEPLTGLDRHLRESMQIEIKSLQRRLGVSMLFVTHDQSEAFNVADRIAILNKGVLEQVATPADLYESPVNTFVAQFVGDSNIVPATAMCCAERTCTLQLASGEVVKAVGEAVPGTAVSFFVRPERLHLHSDEPSSGADNVLRGVISDLCYLGNCIDIRVDVAGQCWLVRRSTGVFSKLPLMGENVILWWRTMDARVL